MDTENNCIISERLNSVFIGLTLELILFLNISSLQWNHGTSFYHPITSQVSIYLGLQSITSKMLVMKGT